MSSRIHTAIVGHWDFPGGLLTAAERIVGKQEDVVPISNDNLGVEDLIRRLEKELDLADENLYIFVDLVGGSCFTACRALMGKHPEWVFIAGVSLPMLVTYLNYRARLGSEELLRKTLESGRHGMEQFCV